MKKLITLFLISATILSCKTEKKSDRNIVIGDTITTSTGLKYAFLKEGFGRKIEEGSKVKVYTDLYLNDADTTIWKTSDTPDSLFTFIHKKTSLITGFTELHNYLREGDEVIGILTHQLAYGEKGRGSVPPKATLVYNPLIVKSVSKSKEVLTDTLVAITKKDGIEKTIQFYENASSDKYHTEIEDVLDVLNEFRKDSSYVSLEKFSDYLFPKIKDENTKQSLYYFRALSLENQGKIKEAIQIVEPLSKEKLNQQYWVNSLKSLKEKLK